MVIVGFSYLPRQLSQTHDGLLIVISYRPAKIDHLSAKNRRFLACLLHHNLITIYTTATKSSSLLQNLMGFLLQLTEKDAAFVIPVSLASCSTRKLLVSSQHLKVHSYYIIIGYRVKIIYSRALVSWQLSSRRQCISS